MAIFKVGDLVQLKAKNSPEMVVQSVDGDALWAQWFSGKKLERGRFPSGSVVAVNPDTKE